MDVKSVWYKTLFDGKGSQLLNFCQPLRCWNWLSLLFFNNLMGFGSYPVNIRGQQLLQSIIHDSLAFPPADWILFCTDQRNVCYAKNFSEAWSDRFPPECLPKQGGRSLYVFTWKQFKSSGESWMPLRRNVLLPYILNIQSIPLKCRYLTFPLSCFLVGPFYFHFNLHQSVVYYYYLCLFCGQVLAAVGHQEAECRFQRLLSCLAHPPSYTCVRASTHLAPLDDIRNKLGEELKKVNFLSWYLLWDFDALSSPNPPIYADVKAADVQVIGREGLHSDSNSPTDSRCAAPSCWWTQVCEECLLSVRPMGIGPLEYTFIH